MKQVSQDLSCSSKEDLCCFFFLLFFIWESLEDLIECLATSQVLAVHVSCSAEQKTPQTHPSKHWLILQSVFIDLNIASATAQYAFKSGSLWDNQQAHHAIVVSTKKEHTYRSRTVCCPLGTRPSAISRLGCPYTRDMDDQTSLTGCHEGAGLRARMSDTSHRKTCPP